MSNNKEIVVRQEISPVNQIKELLGKGITPADLKQFLEIQRDWEANEARKKFAVAFAKTQDGIGKVIKSKHNTQTNSKYADLNDVLTMAKPVYTKEGFSVIFSEAEKVVEETVRVNADVLHKEGHKETYHYDVPLDGIGLKGNPNMTKIHGKSSSISYGRRYLMCMIWNIPTGDDDAQSANVERITEEQLGILRDDLISLGIEDKAQPFLKFMKVESLSDIPKSDFAKAKAALDAKKAKVKK